MIELWQLPMWVDNDSTGDPQGFLAPPSGLFPAPLPTLEGDDGAAGAGVGGGKGKALALQRRSVIGRFRFLGRLAARCLMDGQVRWACWIGWVEDLFILCGRPH